MTDPKLSPQLYNALYKNFIENHETMHKEYENMSKQGKALFDHFEKKLLEDIKDPSKLKILKKVSKYHKKEIFENLNKKHMVGEGMADNLKNIANAITTAKNVANKVGDVVKQVRTVLSPLLNSFNNTSKRTLKKYGDIPIHKMVIRRKPIPAVIQGTINVLTLGKQPHDKLFHLSLIATLADGKNTEIIIEKNETVNITDKFVKNPPQAEYDNVDLKQSGPTLNEMMNKTVERMGKDAFFSYDGYDNNCQVFVKNVLQASGLLSASNDKFIMQDMEKLIEHTPSLARKIGNAGTTLGEIFNRITGQGQKKI